MEAGTADQLKVTLKGQPSAIYERGTGYITGRSARLNRIPSGHPEGYYEAFANVYKEEMNRWGLEHLKQSNLNKQNNG